MLLDLRDEFVAWRKTGTRFALATVVRTWKSAPRPAGAVMAVAENGKVIGSVSGGCVEGAVYGLAQEVLGSGTPQLATFGVGDGDAFAVGLTCGGASTSSSSRWTIAPTPCSTKFSRASVTSSPSRSRRWSGPV